MIDLYTNFSICIPCYNDLKGLRKTLKSLLEQLNRKKKDQIHIVIGLNDCTFDKKKVLKRQNIKPGVLISFFETQKYLDYDSSITFLLSKVSSKFCLIVGCGERALPGLSNALLTFENNNTDFGLLPVCIEGQGSNSARLELGGVWCPAQPGIFNKVLSGHIFRTLNLQGICGIEQFVAYEWAHVEIALNVQGKSASGSVSYSRPVISRPHTDRGWWTKTDIFKQYIEYCDLLIKYGEKYPNLSFVKEELEKAYSIRLALMILQVKGNGLREAPLFLIQWIKKYCTNRMYYFFIKLVLIAPNNAARRLMKLANCLIKLKAYFR